MTRIQPIRGSIIVESKRPTGWQKPGPADLPFDVPTRCGGCHRIVEALAAIDNGPPRCLDCIQELV